MSARLFNSLRARRKKLLAAADKHADELDEAALDALHQRLKVIDALAAEPSRPTWAAPITVALIAASLVLMASTIRLPEAAIDLDAQVSAVEFVVGPRTAEERSSGGALQIEAIELAGADPIVGSVSSLNNLTFAPASLVRVTALGEGCLLVELPRTSGQSPSGALTADLVGPTREDTLPTVTPLQVTVGGAIRVCTQDEAAALFVGQPSKLELSRLHFAGPPELRAGSIITGRMRLRQTGEQSELGPLDKVSLADVREGATLVALGNPIRVAFSGVASEPRRSQGVSQGQLDMAPTLLALVTMSPSGRALIAALSGLVGMIWAVLHYLRLPAR